MKPRRSEHRYGAVDVGAGSGAKIGLFDRDGRQCGESLLPVDRYGGSAESLADGVAEILTDLAARENRPRDALRAVGVACPGLFRSDGSAIVVANVTFLAEASLPDLLRRRLGVPALIANDADAGALAEWSLARTELLYWVFGGGWGGAWVSAEGEVRHSSLDWDGDDASLHYTNEPGFAIPLEKLTLRRLFEGAGASFDRLEELCVEELSPEGGVLTGPSGRTDCVRAELVISGPGRWRIFRTFAEKGGAFASGLSAEEARELGDSAAAGKVITRLSESGVDAAVKTDRLFGRILAEAAGVLFEQAAGDGCPAGVPIYVAGGPSRALARFGPCAEEAMRERGIRSELRLSRLEKEGRNANLLGAAVLAANAAEDPKTSGESP